MNPVLAVDPGTERSALCLWVDSSVRDIGITNNLSLYLRLEEWIRELRVHDPVPVLVVEDIQSYGMSVGRDVFRTCMWAGAFALAYLSPSKGKTSP